MLLHLRRTFRELAAANAKLANELAATSRRLREARRSVWRPFDRLGDVRDLPQAVMNREGVLPITIVDVGAQILDNRDDVFLPLERSGLCRKIAFEPIETEAEKLRKANPDAVVLPFVIGRGGPAVFGLARFSATSSLFEPNMAFLRDFADLPDRCERIDSRSVQTVRLDDIPEAAACDFLKLDVQGGELDVLAGAESALKNIVVVHTEVEFAPLYLGQPLFADIDTFLRARDFELIDLASPGYARYRVLQSDDRWSRLLFADAVYFKSARAFAPARPSALLKAALIAHVNYGYYDLAAYYLHHYDRLTGSDTLSQYADKHGHGGAGPLDS